MNQQKEKYEVFLSYRRDGALETATLLRETLANRGYRVFMDVEALRSGPFNKKLYEVIDNCTDFLLILPPNGLDRCSEEQDWVRLELERAKAGGKNIVPIMLRGFEFPKELPESIDFIRYQNAPPIDTGAYYDAFIDRLIEFLDAEPELKRAEEEKDRKEEERKRKAEQKSKTGKLVIVGGLAVVLVLAVMILIWKPKKAVSVQRIENANPVVKTVGLSDESLTPDEKEKLMQLSQAIQNGEFRLSGQYSISYQFSLTNETDYDLANVSFQAQFKNSEGKITGSSSRSIEDWAKGDSREMLITSSGVSPDSVEICATIKEKEKNLRTDYISLPILPSAEEKLIVFHSLTELPDIFPYHDYDGDRQYLITDLQLGTSDWYINNNRGSGYIYISGKYLSGPENEDGYIGYRILDADGTIYKTGYISIPRMKQGDAFAGISQYVSDIPAGEYLMELTEHKF